jgi:hypothetical protein
MITNGTHEARFLDLEAPTDMELALSISRMLDSCCNSSGEAGQGDWRETVISIARNVLNGMTNPFAKKLLADQIGE